MAIGTLLSETFFDNILGRNPGMIRSRHPQDIIPLKPPVAA
jgi:hypothetical protein